MTTSPNADTIRRLTAALLRATDPASKTEEKLTYFREDIAVLIRRFFPAFLDDLASRVYDYPTDQKSTRTLLDGSRFEQSAWEEGVDEQIEKIFGNLWDPDFTWTAQILHDVDYPGVDRAVVKTVRLEWGDPGPNNDVLALQSKVETEIHQVREEGYPDVLSYHLMAQHIESQKGDDPWIVLDSRLTPHALLAPEQEIDSPEAERADHSENETLDEKSVPEVEEPELTPEEAVRRAQEEIARTTLARMLEERIDQIERAELTGEQGRREVKMARMFFDELLNVVIRDTPSYDARDGAERGAEWSRRAQEAVWRAVDRLEDWSDGWGAEVLYWAHDGDEVRVLNSLSPVPLAVDAWEWAMDTMELQEIKNETFQGWTRPQGKFAYRIFQESSIHNVRTVEFDSRTPRLHRHGSA